MTLARFVGARRRPADVVGNHFSGSIGRQQDAETSEIEAGKHELRCMHQAAIYKRFLHVLWFGLNVGRLSFELELEHDYRAGNFLTCIRPRPEHLEMHDGCVKRGSTSLLCMFCFAGCHF